MEKMEYIPRALDSSFPVLILCDSQKVDEITRLAQRARPQSAHLNRVSSSFDFYRFFEDNANRDVILTLEGPAAQDSVVVNLLKKLMLAMEVNWSSRTYSSKFTYTGRLTVITAKAEDSVKSHTLCVEI